MKKLIVLFLISVSSIFAQNWNTVIQTSIPFTFYSEVDQFSNKDGINVLLDYYQRNWPTGDVHYLKYYLLSSSGSVIRSFQFENQEVQLASIDGDNEKIYVVYKLGNQLKTRKSTNAGQSWITTIANIDLGSNTCNHVDITFGKDDNALHVVWATQDAGSNYKTYYKRLDPSNAWGPKEDVTDGSNVGGFPTVSKSTNRIHVSYNTGNQWSPEVNLGDAKSRDKNVNTWQTPQLIFPTESFRERIHAGSSKLFDFYYKLETGMGQYQSDLYVKERSFSSNTWSSGLLLQSYSEVATIVSAANTVDGKSHIVYAGPGNITYRYYDGTTWSSENSVGDGFYIPKLSATSNDLFLVWGGWGLDSVYLRQYDAAPLAPANYSVSVYQSGTNYYPRLTWSLNNEPDVRQKTSNAYKIEKRTRPLNGTWTSWTTLANLSGTTASYIDYSINNASGGDREAEYRIIAMDLGNNSSPAQSVTIEYGMYIQDKITVSGMVRDYSLDQNYPNPFNPSTKISYSIKEEGLVTLKVYDILGKEIVTLVNENKPAGIYEAEFNASQLPSGLYIYKLQASSFSDVKKMLLTK